MSPLQYTKFEALSLKEHTEFSEKWLQDRIAEDPTILGLGELILKDKEKIQPKAGRLDLLLQNPDTNERYEVEIQLGHTDESHIIRTIEYWDIERKRYPQYDHIAVIIAEDVTSRFLNIIGLFNGCIPLIALQLNAIQIDGKIALVFTKVLDQVTLGTEEDDDGEPVDRSYWEKRSAKDTVELADDIVKIIKEFAPKYSLKYNTGYVGLTENGQSNNFAIFFPKKKFIRMSVRLEKSKEVESKINEAGLDIANYTKRGRYVLRLTKEDVKDNKELLKEILQKSYKEFFE